MEGFKASQSRRLTCIHDLNIILNRFDEMIDVLRDGNPSI
jgi:hypothetical protein